MDYKSKKLIEIVKEWLKDEVGRYEINGVDKSRAVFFYRERYKNFEPIPKGNYKVVDVDNNTFLEVDKELNSKAYEYQIIYENKLKAEKYTNDFYELDMLVKKYNDLVSDVRNIISLLETTGVKTDTLKMSQILTPLEPNTIWSANSDGKIESLPIGNLNQRYLGMLEDVRKESQSAIDKAIAQGQSKAYEILETKTSELLERANTLFEEIKQTKNNALIQIQEYIDESSRTKEDIIATMEETKNVKIGEIKNKSTDYLSQISQAFNNTSRSILSKGEEAKRQINDLSSTTTSEIEKKKKEISSLCETTERNIPIKVQEEFNKVASNKRDKTDNDFNTNLNISLNQTNDFIKIKNQENYHIASLGYLNNGFFFWDRKLDKKVIESNGKTTNIYGNIFVGQTDNNGIAFWDANFERRGGDVGYHFTDKFTYLWNFKSGHYVKLFDNGTTYIYSNNLKTRAKDVVGAINEILAKIK